MADPIIHKAAGILFVTAEGKALFLKRGNGGDAPGMWCFPGGTVEGDETTEQTAKREATEELGKYPKGPLTYHTRSVSPVVTDNPNIAPGAIADLVDFTTYLQRVSEEFTPQLNGEHTGWAWSPLSEPPAPTHPGCQIAVDRFTMDELGVARAMAEGRLTSPQLYGNVHLFDMRITGTGVAYRGQKKDDAGQVVQKAEFVYRRPENYLTADFLARCNGLQVILLHPDEVLLNSKEFTSRSVGAMMLPYLKGDEVWGIAKIYDDGAIKALTSNQLSTSPGVILGAGDQRITMEDGSPLLIEGKPSLLDHLAICERGVWDKGGEPRGVRLDNQTGDINMTDDDKKVLDEKIAASLAASLPEAIKAGIVAARADAAGTDSKLDQILLGLGAIGKRVDALEVKRADSDDDKKKADAAACFGGRMDGESDEDMKKRFDSAEEKVKADSMASGDPEPVAADRAKRARKDAEETDDNKKKADAAEKMKADALSIKADSVPRSEFDRVVAANVEMAGRLVAIEKAMPRQISDTERHQFSSVQARADEVYVGFGQRASVPLIGETVLDYRKRLANGLKPNSATWKGVDILVADSAAFDVAEEQIYKEAAISARNPVDLPRGELRPITRQDAATGLRTTDFVGNGSFIGVMKRPSSRVTRINVGGVGPTA